MTSESNENISAFVDEAREQLAVVETALIDFEQVGESALSGEIINELFRAVHTVKGGAAFLKLEKLRDLAHAMENVFGLIREKRLAPNPTVISTLLRCTDACTVAINAPSSSHELETEELLRELAESAGRKPTGAGSSETGEFLHIVLSSGKCLFSLAKKDLPNIRQAEQQGSHLFIVTLDVIADAKAAEKTFEGLLNDLAGTGFLLGFGIDTESIPPLGADLGLESIPASCLVLTKFSLDDFLLQFPFLAGRVERYSLPVDERAPPLAEKVEKSEIVPQRAVDGGEGTEAKESKESEHHKNAETNSIRVHVHILDKLMALAGELVLTRNQLLQCVIQNDMKQIEDAAQRVDLITSEMQDAIMRTRMQSVGVVFEKFKRVVRDLSSSLGKKVKLQLEGLNVELDRTIIEAVNAPLTHLVRNAIDHGLESAPVREAVGKPAEGTLRMSALHKAGQVVIEIADDGGGVDVDKVRKKAIQQGIITAEQSAVMPDEKAIRLIFRPGFSTKDVVTDISGRGVGIDVVQSNIAKLGGVTDVLSKRGAGTTFRIKLPLTLAIIPSLLVALDGKRYAIPQVNLVELVRVRPDEVRTRVERIGKATVMRLRGELLPLVDLREVLGLPKLRSEHANVPLACNIVVVSAGDFRYGIIVDSMLDSAEIVVKPLGSDLGECKMYAGATILGDGQVALILDVVGIAAWIHTRDLHPNDKNKDGSLGAGLDHLRDRQTLLVFENAPGEWFAIALNLVEHIERVEHSRLVNVGTRRALRQKNSTMTVLGVEDVVPVSAVPEQENYYVVVLRVEGHDVGILVGNLVDIVDTDAEVDDISYVQEGVVGSIILGDRVVLLVDPYEIIEHKMPELVERLFATKEEAREILAVDDSEFYRKQISHFLKEAGFHVTLANDGQKAWEILNSGTQKFDMLVTDVEMPKLDGLGLVERIRGSETLKKLPVVAITSRLSQADIEKGYELGFNMYLPKLNREELVETCRVLLGCKDEESMATTERLLRRSIVRTSNDHEFVVFNVGEFLCGINIDCVQEIDRLLPILPVQHAPSFVRGVINLRGEIVTVIDMRQKLGAESIPLRKSMRIILANGANERVGLLVDGVSDILGAGGDKIVPVPSHLDPLFRRFVSGVHETEDSLVSIIDLERILEHDDLGIEQKYVKHGEAHA